MHTAAKVAGYALGLVAVFFAAVEIGTIVGPNSSVTAAVDESHAAEADGMGATETAAMAPRRNCPVG